MNFRHLLGCDTIDFEIVSVSRPRARLHVRLVREPHSENCLDLIFVASLFEKVILSMKTILHM